MIPQDLIRYHKHYFETLSESDDPSEYVWSVFADRGMPATRTEAISRAEAERKAASEPDWHEPEEEDE